MQKPREIAFHVLARRERGEDFVEHLLDDALLKSSLSPVDRGLCTELVYGVTRRLKTLDWLIARKTQAGRNQKKELTLLLRLGLYQIFWLGRIPDHAAVHETVEMGKKLGFAPQAGFLNAVLRAYVREKAETEKLLEELVLKEPAVGHSHPDWLVERWQNRWGPEKTRALLEWNNTAAYTFARVNTLKADPATLTHQWAGENVKFTAKTFDWIDDGLVFLLDSHPPLTTLPSFKQGLFYVQDPSTLLAAREMDAKPGETVLDYCAAPGGKTTFMAQLMQNRGKIVAQDLQPDRLRMVQENCVRLGVTCVHIATSTDGLVAAVQTPQFDRILIDAPCSNTGVLRRRIDLRWRLRPEEIERLRRTQLDILKRCAPRLKPGGVLLYSTCSLEAEENSQVISEFLVAHREFKLQKERSLLPWNEGVDGGYVARLMRSKEIQGK